MTDSIRIKRFLKNGIQTKILSAKQILLLNAKELVDETELQGIEEATIEKILEDIKSKMYQSSLDRRQNARHADNIMQLIEEKVRLHQDEVKNILGS
ncbi:MAG: hypothetical protein HOK67_19360 [Deltaproteobacteria bacterium]|jgi:hypothetical protein|nr:hypothetical protein [Deltaproteobacteria bacterium]MBT4643872.1 hypothetical protein [Deltaproteobacteria bacterium]MBT6502047.1 hypothetical protein [Deltaproteobacteria bacterium]MBT7154056.1 hypothetical protein [Deltaproteobacteria bacterium]